MANMNFRQWLEENEGPWKSEENERDYRAWVRSVESRMSTLRSPSGALSDFVGMYVKTVAHCSKYAPNTPGSFAEFCLRNRHDDFLRQVNRGSFDIAPHRAAGTWADGMSPSDLGAAYFVLFGRKIAKPGWVDRHQGTSYIPHTRRVPRKGSDEWDTEYYNHETGNYEPKR